MTAVEMVVDAQMGLKSKRKNASKHARRVEMVVDAQMGLK